MAHQINIRYRSHIDDKVAEEETLLNKINHLRNEVHSERASRAEEKLRASEQEEKLREERDKLKKMLITYDEALSSTMLKRNATDLPKKAKTRNASMQVSQLEEERKQQEALEKENLELTVLLDEQKSLSSKLQLEASETQKTLLHSREEINELLHDYKKVKGLLKSVRESNVFLHEEIQCFKQHPQRESAEKVCQTTGSPCSWDHEAKIKAWEYEKDVLLKTSENLNLTVARLLKLLNKNDAELAALRQENQELRQLNESCVEEEVVGEGLQEEVRVETPAEPPQVSRDCTDELISIKRRRKPSRWRRFINSITQAVEEE